MKQIGIVLVMVMMLAGCGTSSQPNTQPAEKKEETPSANLENYENLREGCPEPTQEGQVVADLSKEEKELYDLDPSEMKDKMPQENYETYKKYGVLQQQRRIIFRKILEEEGVSLDDLMKVGRIRASKGSILLEFKSSLKEEEKEIKNQFMEVVKKARETMSPKAILVKDVQYSNDEMRGIQDRLAGKVLNEEATTGNKVTGIGTCSSYNALRVEAWTNLDEEELTWLNEMAEIPLAININEPNREKGYVTSLHDERMLVNMVWFSSIPEGVQVGDRVEVAYAMVAESFPAQSRALEAKILPNKKPEDADLATSEAIQQAIEKVERDGAPLSVHSVDYHKEEDQWTIQFKKGMEDNVEITLEDE